jgi:Flp pilus assembly protein TadG
MKTRGRQSGQALIETSLMLVIVFVALVWILEVCMLMYTYTVIADAANEGARYAIVQQNIVADDARVQARVTSFARSSLHDVSAISTSVTLPDTTNIPPNRVRVTVTYTYVPWLRRYIPTPTMHAYAEARMVVQ